MSIFQKIYRTVRNLKESELNNLKASVHQLPKRDQTEKFQTGRAFRLKMLNRLAGDAVPAAMEVGWPAEMARGWLDVLVNTAAAVTRWDDWKAACELLKSDVRWCPNRNGRVRPRLYSGSDPPSFLRELLNYLDNDLVCVMQLSAPPPGGGQVQADKSTAQEPQGKCRQENARHSKDFSYVHWYGEDYEFNKVQASIVGDLWAAWKNGTPVIRGETLLKEAGRKNGRMDHIFRGNRAWKTMIIQGGSKGAYRLNPPTPQ